MQTPITHPQLVTQLAKPGDDIIRSLTPEKAHIWHMASCLPGEAGELLEGILHWEPGQPTDNLVEELGDIEFYLEGYRQGTGINRNETLSGTFVKDDNITRIIAGVIITCADLFDCAKRYVIYCKAFDHERSLTILAKLELALLNLRIYIGTDYDTVVKANIDKLSVRYNQLTYSDESAQQRADKQVQGTLTLTDE